MCGSINLEGFEHGGPFPIPVLYHISTPCACNGQEWESVTIRCHPDWNLRPVHRRPHVHLAAVLAGHLSALCLYIRAFICGSARPRVLVLKRDGVLLGGG